MDLFVKIKFFVFVILCLRKEIIALSVDSNTNQTTEIARNVSVILIQPAETTGINNITNITTIPDTTDEGNKNDSRDVTESSPLTTLVTEDAASTTTEVLATVTNTDNDTVTTTDPTISPKDTNASNVMENDETTKFSEVSFIDNDETTTMATTLEKRDVRVSKGSHWSEDDAIDRFAEEAQTVRVTTKVKDENWLKNQLDLSLDHDPFRHLRFKTAAAPDLKGPISNPGYISRVLSNHIYPAKNKDRKYELDVKKSRFFDDSLIRPTHKVDRIRFHKNYPHEQGKDSRQVSVNPKKVYSVVDMYRPGVLNFVESMTTSGDSKNIVPPTPLANVVPGGYVPYHLPLTPEKKVMKKFFRKIFDNKSKPVIMYSDNILDEKLKRSKEAIVYVASDGSHRSVGNSKSLKETLDSIGELGDEEKNLEAERCEILKHVFFTRTLEKKITNLEKLFMKLFGVLLNSDKSFPGGFGDTLQKAMEDNKQYYYIVSGSNPHKRSLQLIKEEPAKSLNVVKVDCDKFGRCGMKRFRKSVTDDSSKIDKEVHISYDTNDVSKILDALLNATNEAMSKFNATQLKGKNQKDAIAKQNIRNNTGMDKQKYYRQYSSFGGNTSPCRNCRNTTEFVHKLKKHRFIPSPKTEETLRKLKILIHKYNLSENTFVRKLYESIKKAQKLNNSETSFSSQESIAPKRKIYRNKYEMAKHSKEIMEKLRMARDFAHTVKQQTRREKRQLKELTENQNHTLMLMDFLMDQDFPLEVTHEDDYVDFMTELVSNAHYLKQPRKKTTTSKPKRKAPEHLNIQASSEDLIVDPTKKNKRNTLRIDHEAYLAGDKIQNKEYHPNHYDKRPFDNH